MFNWFKKLNGSNAIDFIERLKTDNTINGAIILPLT